jgi:hypothetical protein
VLQGVNKEFQRLLTRNKEIEEEISISDMGKQKQKREIEDMKEQL